MNLVWFRRDLRIDDNPALYFASQKKEGVIALFIETTKTWQRHDMGDVQKHFLQQNLIELEKDLSALNIPFIHLKTDYFSECPGLIKEVAKKYDIKNLYYNRQYEWDELKRDALIHKKLQSETFTIHAYDEQCLIPPHLIKSQKGTPYTVFTPFKKASLQFLKDNPNYLNVFPRPEKQKSQALPLKKYTPSPILLNQDISWLKPGNHFIKKHLSHFIEKNISDYQQQRDYPFIEGTSKISPYLALGVISVRECLGLVIKRKALKNFDDLLKDKGIACWLSELLWRDFYKMIMFQFPHVSKNKAFKRQTDKLTWHHNESHLLAWQQGKTGIPIIDAAMRQLNQTGWMHNRLRMITAMFLSKNLWLDWRLGEAYFAKKLVDWDFSANNGGWQWSASTGNDAAPYFRVFNPISQSERFDKNGEFIKKYCPELAGLDAKQIHTPHALRGGDLEYPKPLVDLKSTRAYAISQFKALSEP